MDFACEFCFRTFPVGEGHLYECATLNERIKNIHPKKKTRRSQPLSALTHSGERGVGRPEICNCEVCIELDESESSNVLNDN